MGDEHDAHALVDDRPQRAEQRVDLLWGQVRRRLVEHEHLGPAVERLEDLDALAQAHREVGDRGLRVDGQAEPLGELGDRLAAAALRSTAGQDGSAVPRTMFSVTV